ncbi:MAG: hypothetical protein GXP29_06925 [Planctomycetes bacterium]|nr:hypothetical protein [Planctomycetota bacterium]
MLQLSHSNGLIAMFLFAVILAVVVTLFFFAIPDIRSRRKIKRFLTGSGFAVARIRRLHGVGMGKCGYDGYAVAYHEKGELKKAEFRTVDGRNFHVFYDLPGPTLLIYYDEDGSSRIHALPKTDLVRGEFLYYFLRIKHDALTSLLAAIIVAFVVVAITFAVSDLLKPPTLNMPYLLANITSLWKAFLAATGAIAMVGLVIASPGLACLTYRYLRSELIMSDKPICQGCEYDLRGNESAVCPECGEEVSDYPPWVTRTGEVSPWAGQLCQHPLGRIKNWRRGDSNP